MKQLVLTAAVLLRPLVTGKINTEETGLKMN
jgi:hypothetical protein